MPVRILHLEDNARDAELAERQLRRSSMECTFTHVASETEFRAAIAREQYDVVLADYHLPDFDGIRALRIARETAPDLPFVFLSGSIGEERAIEALREGADDYILKDRPSRLAPAIESAMKRRGEIRRRKIADMRATEAERLARLGHWSYEFATGRREWSSGMYRMFGFDGSEELTTEKILARVHPNDRPIAGAITQSIPVAMTSYIRIPDSDGHNRVLALHAESETDESGRLIRRYGTAQDVTEIVEAQQTIRELSRTNDLILNYAADGIVAISRSGALIFANPAAHRMLGWPGEADLSDVHRALHPHEKDGEPCALRTHIGTATHISEEGVFFNVRRDSFEVRYTCAPIVENESVTGTVLTFSDISTSKQLERQLDQARRVSSLGRIAATIAHEFNNVLMGIQPFAELIRNRSSDERASSAATQILASVARGRRVAHDMLRTTRVSQPEVKPVEMGRWLSQLEPELRALLRTSVVLRIDRPETPLHATCDAAQMQQVITNLVANARDAMPEGGEIMVRLDHVSRRDSTMVRLTVADSGTGIAPEVIPRIFEPLFTTKRNGTGLGLSVVQQLVTQSGGSIEVVSELGNGTTFTILLRPGRDGADEAQPAGTAAIPVRKLLLVEDDSSVAEGLAAMLESEGIDVRVVTRGADAVPAVEEFAPDAAVIDIGLPDIAGDRVYDNLIKRWPDLPVVFSTGHGDAARLARQLANPSVRLLHKPYDLATLLNTLREIA